ncbi:MAG: DUF2809 domain-containing protein [Bacteroidales bacterium]|nr:DUF2809 domain-containing protein [Bacteroidales bacterium]
MWLIIVAIIGLATKFYPGPAYHFVNNKLSSIPYILFFCVAVLLFWPRIPLLRNVIIVVGVTCIVEFTQLYNADWIEYLRSFLIVRLLIGNSFSPTDFIMYPLGGLVSYFVIKYIMKDKGY